MSKKATWRDITNYGHARARDGLALCFELEMAGIIIEVQHRPETIDHLAGWYVSCRGGLVIESRPLNTTISLGRPGDAKYDALRAVQERVQEIDRACSFAGGER